MALEATNKTVHKKEKPHLGLKDVQASLRTKIRLYHKRSKEIENYLSKNPDEWGKFQSEFNAEVNSIFSDIMNFEKANIAKGDMNKIHKLREIFIKRIRKIFTKGGYGKWCLSKPYGYSGDFKIIDDIYQNNPTSKGFDRLFDNYFQMTSISVAVRNRKEDFKRMIIDFANNHNSPAVKIMSLASGPCRDIKEILMSENLSNKNVVFHCYDNDENAIEYAKKLLKGFSNVKLTKENALKLALTKDAKSRIPEKFDLIYATGLFDYINYNISVRLVENLKKLLNPGGMLAISDVRDKYSNPSVHYMEWMGDWRLLYRDDDEFKQMFIDAGFKEGNLSISYEQQGIMQYILATNK